MEEQSDADGSYDEDSSEGKKPQEKKVSMFQKSMLRKLTLRVQMMRHPKAIKGSEVLEWWMLKAYFDSSDHKFLYKIRDQFEQDMQLNFMSGTVTRATEIFANAYKSDYDMKIFKQTDLMKELVKEPQSRDSDKLDDIVKLFQNLRFMGQFGMLEQSDMREFAQSIKLHKFKPN